MDLHNYRQQANQTGPEILAAFKGNSAGSRAPVNREGELEAICKSTVFFNGLFFAL